MVLRGIARAAFFADIDSFFGPRSVLQKSFIGQKVVDNHIGLCKSLDCAKRNQAGISWACPYKIYLTF